MTSGHRSCNIIINRKLLETISQMSQNCESKYSEARFLSQLCSFTLARSGPVPRKAVRVHLRSWSRSYSTCSRHSRSGGRVGPTTPRRRNSLFGAPRSPADAPSGGTVSPAASEKSATSTWLGLGLGIGLGIGLGLGSGLGRLGKERDRYRLGRREPHADHQ